MSTNIYCTYLTVYSGNKLPPFYIGSSRIDIIQEGYHGSVSSIKYKSIWKSELRNNPSAFKTKIISYHETRQEANLFERKLQIKLNVVNNPLYINRNITWDSNFGAIGSGENHYNYGRKHSQDYREKLSALRVGENNSFFGKHHTEKTRELIGSYHKGKIITEEHKKSMAPKISKSKIGLKWYNDGVDMYQLKPNDPEIVNRNLAPGMIKRKV
jgi:hypothetical protein